MGKSKIEVETKRMDELRDFVARASIHVPYSDEFDYLQNMSCVVEIREIIRKEVPRKAVHSGNFQLKSELYNCPNCGKNLGNYLNNRSKKRCDDCGQRLEFEL